MIYKNVMILRMVKVVKGIVRKLWKRDRVIKSFGIGYDKSKGFLKRFFFMYIFYKW